MSRWYDTFNDVFWLAAGTTVFSFLAILVKMAYRSKCDQIKFCSKDGLLVIHRRVELEHSDDDSHSEEKKNTT